MSWSWIRIHLHSWGYLLVAPSAGVAAIHVCSYGATLNVFIWTHKNIHYVFMLPQHLQVTWHCANLYLQLVSVSACHSHVTIAVMWSSQQHRWFVVLRRSRWADTEHSHISALNWNVRLLESGQVLFCPGPGPGPNRMSAATWSMTWLVLPPHSTLPAAAEKTWSGFVLECQALQSRTSGLWGHLTSNNF